MISRQVSNPKHEKQPVRTQNLQEMMFFTMMNNGMHYALCNALGCSHRNYV